MVLLHEAFREHGNNREIFYVASPQQMRLVETFKKRGWWTEGMCYFADLYALEHRGYYNGFQSKFQSSAIKRCVDALYGEKRQAAGEYLMKIVHNPLLGTIELSHQQWKFAASFPVKQFTKTIGLILSNGNLEKAGILKCVEFLNQQALKRITSLDQVKDCLMYGEFIKRWNFGGQKYNSIKAMKEEHDRIMAEHRAEERRRNAHYNLYYTEAIQNVIPDGWWLPHNTMEFVERGEEHHNCVASYRSRHFRKDYTHRRYTNAEGTETRSEEYVGEIMLLMMCNDATLEFRVNFNMNGTVSGVYVAQCKGLYNKDYPIPITELSITIWDKLTLQDFEMTEELME